jgi:hypothetical protein
MKLLIATMLIWGLVTGEKQSASFVLRNESNKSIPLVIPGVMNPNLSPMSNSGVTLAEGQEIFFLEKKKRYLLLEVSPDLNGDTLIVNELIDKRRVELGL